MLGDSQLNIFLVGADEEQAVTQLGEGLGRRGADETWGVAIGALRALGASRGLLWYSLRSQSKCWHSIYDSSA